MTQNLRDHIRSVFHDFESPLRRNRLEEREIIFNLPKFTSIFTTYEIPPGFFEFFDIDKTLEKNKSQCFFEIITMKSRLKNTMFYDLMKNRFSIRYKELLHICVMNLLLNSLVEKKIGKNNNNK